MDHIKLSPLSANMEHDITALLVTVKLVLSAHYQWPNFNIVPWYFCSEMRPKTNVIFCQNLENF